MKSVTRVPSGRPATVRDISLPVRGAGGWEAIVHPEMSHISSNLNSKEDLDYIKKLVEGKISNLSPFAIILDELFDKYKLAISELTIDDSVRVQVKEVQIQKQYSALQEERQKHFEEKKKWYKTILDRAKTEGEIPEWLRPVMDEMIQEFES
jgi:hypothetical protein